MNKQSRDKIEVLIKDLKTKIEMLSDLSSQENEPLKKLSYSELSIERSVQTIILGRNITDLSGAQSKLFDTIHNLENILCREVTE